MTSILAATPLSFMQPVRRENCRQNMGSNDGSFHKLIGPRFATVAPVVANHRLRSTFPSSNSRGRASPERNWRASDLDWITSGHFWLFFSQPHPGSFSAIRERGIDKLFRRSGGETRHRRRATKACQKEGRGNAARYCLLTAVDRCHLSAARRASQGATSP